MLQRAEGMLWLPPEEMLKKHIYAEAEEHEAKLGSFQGTKKVGVGCSGRTAGWSQRPCHLMFDESNLAELGLDLSKLTTNKGHRRGEDHQHSAVYKINLY